MSAPPSTLSPTEAAELILSLGGGPAPPRAPLDPNRAPRAGAPPRVLDHHAPPATKGGKGVGRLLDAQPRRHARAEPAPHATGPPDPRRDATRGDARPTSKRAAPDDHDHDEPLRRPRVSRGDVAHLNPDAPERKRLRRAPTRIQPDVEDDARMGNRGTLGLERLSRAQQREFWRRAGDTTTTTTKTTSTPTSNPNKRADSTANASTHAGDDRDKGRHRGVTRYKRTGRFEAHIWDRGRQKHLGSFGNGTDAAAAYDKTAIKFRGWAASPLNFPPETYASDRQFRADLATLNKGEFVAKMCAGGKRSRVGASEESKEKSKGQSKESKESKESEKKKTGGTTWGSFRKVVEASSSLDTTRGVPPGLTLADTLVRAQMLEDPDVAPRPQHVLSLAPMKRPAEYPDSAEESEEESESEEEDEDEDEDDEDEGTIVSESESEPSDDPLAGHRGVILRWHHMIDPASFTAHDPPPSREDTLTLARALVTNGVVTPAVALAFPRELLAAASRELELANACGLYRRRGAVTGAVTGGGDTNRPQVGTSRGSPNASTLAAARRMATGPGHEALVATAPTPELLTNVEWTGEMDTAILMAASRRGANASTWATLVIPRGPCAGWTNAQVAERFAFLCERAKTQPCSQEKEQTKAEKNTVWLDALVSPTHPAAGGPDEGFVTPIVPHKAHTPSPTPPRATPPALTPQQKERRGSRTPPLGYKRGDTSSTHKGVTRHRRSGRWEAHLWSRTRGKQLYLGGFDTEAEAARAFDVCSLKKWRDEGKGHGLGDGGVLASQGLNFEFGDYSAVAPVIDAMSLEDVVTAVRQGKLREHYV